MNRRLRLVLFVSILLSTTSVFSGCLSASEDPGPLTVQLEAVDVHAPGNLTLHLVYENTGDIPLSRIETQWDGTIWYTNGSSRDHARSEIYGEYGRWELSNRPEGVFNETDVLPPGATKHANITVRYPPPGDRLRDGEVYSVRATSVYETPDTIYRWSYLLPCVDANGEKVEAAACDSWRPAYPISKTK